MPRFFRNLLIWLVFFNWPPIVALIPLLQLLAFFPLLFWINIPGLFLVKLIGPTHLRVEAFGVLPDGPIGCGLIVIFWALIAVCFALVNDPINRILRRKKTP